MRPLLTLALWLTSVPGALAAGREGAVPTETRLVEATAAGRAERPFLFVADPSQPAPAQVLVTAGLGFAAAGSATGTGVAARLVPTSTVEVGLRERLSAFAAGEASLRAGRQSLSAHAGLSLSLLGNAQRGLQAAVRAAGGRSLDSRPFALVAAGGAYDTGRLKLATSLTLAHAFALGADALDFAAAAAASLRLSAHLRLGLELVAQELEERPEGGPDGGLTAFGGPTFAWEANDRLTIVGGPALGMLQGEAAALGRLAVTLGF